MDAKSAARLSLNLGTIAFFVIISAIPFYWMLITVFTPDPEFYTGNRNSPFVVDTTPTTQNVERLLTTTNYPRFLLNSVIVGVATVVITLVLAVPAAYSLARLSGAWGERLGMMIFMVYLIPPTLLFIPLSPIVAGLRLTNTLWSLIVIYPTFTVPFCTWLLMGFMKSIPRDVEEQAMVDGYSRLEAIIRVVFPLALPGILTIIVFAFTLSMNEYIYALVLAQSQRVISTGITSELIRGDVTFWQSIMAAGLFVAIPVAILYNLFLDRFVSGLTLGAVKG